MNNNQCPYQGECEIYPCNPEQSCYTRQILDERNQAEKRVKELEEENKILKGWREISHKRINDLSQRVKSYIKHTNKLTCEINDLRDDLKSLQKMKVR